MFKSNTKLNHKTKNSKSKSHEQFQNITFCVETPCRKRHYIFWAIFDKIIPLAQSALVNTTTILYFNPLQGVNINSYILSYTEKQRHDMQQTLEPLQNLNLNSGFDIVLTSPYYSLLITTRSLIQPAQIGAQLAAIQKNRDMTCNKHQNPFRA